MTPSARVGVATFAAALVAACAPLPPAQETMPSHQPAPATGPRFEHAPRTPRAGFVARHVELANKALAAGDLAEAEDHWQVLSLVDPENASYAQALQSAREAIRKGVREHFLAGQAARRNGDGAKAKDAFLRVLALDPAHGEAAKALREIEHAAMAKTQADRAARVRAADDVIAGARARAQQSAAANNDGYDLEQRLEIVRAGDLQAGLRELRAWVEANPNDRAGRQRAGGVIAERARDAEAKGLRESALSLYEQAASLAGAPQPEWATRTQSLRKALGEQYYTEGMKLYRTDLPGAIRQWEAGAKFDPSNANLQMRLREAKLAHDKLQKIGDRPK
jgi:tetratricopeptide (TPR) repeat protein